MSIVVTGGAGAIGTALVNALAADRHPVRVLDLHAPESVPAGAEALRADIRDLAALTSALSGATAVVHLAGIPQEAPFPDLCEHNILGTYHVLEAARRAGVTRVVLASSHHTVGFHPVDRSLTPQDAPAPDTFYAVSKLAGEHLGYLYAHKHGLEVVAVRIGSFREHPTEPRHRHTWLSPRDATALLHSAATAPLADPYTVLYGISANTARWWPDTGWDTIGYRPQDDAAAHPAPGPLTDRWQGGGFAEHPGPQL
ncbi:NAD-dependent epimerase/dehydratase family protein [Saccharothrix sp. ST-888]|uniref:NAD-dependent epimerase/dehydratase family protein n=1 Tax=Saccharothrix sp. ST-888 TaxID=1427391 RepID=UPI0005EC082B|nr:NAD(P)-dependent oxidoreductase [Saccharothrix sp. ST-888]KJK56438.1 3-beta hydroxysteroid dehydrogenase [Saccharothrix sp. ST-888]